MQFVRVLARGRAGITPERLDQVRLLACDLGFVDGARRPSRLRELGGRNAGAPAETPKKEEKPAEKKDEQKKDKK